jgi:hypothetical protein
MSGYLDRIIPKVNVPEGTSGKWSVKYVDVPESIIGRLRERHFEPGRYTQLLRGNGLVMSDTPAERWDHVSFVRAATGDVLISGLGLGMCLGAVLRKPDVKSVTVIEIDTDVIALVAPAYRDPRVTIIHADARYWLPPKGKRFGAVWHDIWPDICGDNLPEMHSLNRRYGRRADWKGCWSQEMLRS